MPPPARQSCCRSFSSRLQPENVGVLWQGRAAAASLAASPRGPAMTRFTPDLLADKAADLTAIRRDIHRHPETAFEETRTAQIVADKLTSWGIEIHRGLATTGVV